MKYFPKTKEELKALCDDESIYLGDIDTSKITDMSELFKDSDRKNFSGIENWDVSNVQNMSFMFAYVKSFNQDISKWDVSNVENMEGMFAFTKAFNQPIGDWDVSNVENMQDMFAFTKAFNQPIGDWDVSNVENMQGMFYRAIAFNQPIGSWNVSNVKNMQGMFALATAFNQPIDDWDVSNVEDMREMFKWVDSFNQILPEAWAKEARYKNPEPLNKNPELFKLDELCSSMVALFDKAGVEREDLKKAFNAALQSNKKNIMRCYYENQISI